MNVPMTEPQDVLAEAGTRHYRGPHKPVGDGLCEHRWRNRTTVQVHCGWADGYRAALVRTPETLDVERLREMSTRRLADALAAGNPWFSMTRDRWLAMAAGLQDHLDLAATPSPTPPEGLEERTDILGSRTFCGRCSHPMHWYECGADANLTAGPCRCRNDISEYGRLAVSPAPDPGAGLREALADANRIIAMTRDHLEKDHPDCAYTGLGLLNDASRARLAAPSAEPPETERR